jgi:hypothetical protein
MMQDSPFSVLLEASLNIAMMLVFDRGLMKSFVCSDESN